MVGMLIHMRRAVYIHMALHNSWTLRARLLNTAINHIIEQKTYNTLDVSSKTCEETNAETQNNQTHAPLL